MHWNLRIPSLFSLLVLVISLLVRYRTRESVVDVLIDVPKLYGPPPAYRAPLLPPEIDLDVHEPDNYEIWYRDCSYTLKEHIQKVAQLWGEPYFIANDETYIRLSDNVIELKLVWRLGEEGCGYIFACAPQVLDKLRSDEMVKFVDRVQCSSMPSVVIPDIEESESQDTFR